jgi:hypothetical protein
MAVEGGIYIDVGHEQMCVRVFGDRVSGFTQQFFPLNSLTLYARGSCVLLIFRKTLSLAAATAQRATT